MSRFHSYLNTSIQIINTYTGSTPLAPFLRSFFAANKKYGSKDRKQITALVYNYFRLGHSAKDMPPEQKIILANFLCEKENSLFLESLRPELNQLLNLPSDKKARLTQINISEIFPYGQSLSKGIDADAFSSSFLIQPDLFLRIRPKTRISVLKKIEKSDLQYTLEDDCIRLSNATNTDEHFIADKEVVIQDYNSQKVFDFFKPRHDNHETPLTPVWDCCAASGGKSILLYDIFNHRIDLTVSDIRPSIILNLHQRFKKAGVKEYKYFITDIGSPGFQYPLKESSIIICDVPCTGSGTWARTPENLCYFNPDTISDFSIRQKKIGTNVIPYLKKDGLLVYITCSVFKQENEDVVEYLADQFNLEILEMKILKGYDIKADSMFVAVLKKNQ